MYFLSLSMAEVNMDHQVYVIYKCEHVAYAMVIYIL